MTVGEMLARMSSEELTEWRAYERIEPFGCPAEDFRAGLYPALKTNAQRAEDARIAPTDFYPWNATREETEHVPPTELSAKVVALFEQLKHGKAPE
jgi:hypothetical protein